MHTRSRTVALCVVVAGMLAWSGCDLTRFTASSTAALFHRATPAVEAHFDYELVGSALPGAILQSEGVLSVVPDDAQLCLDTARSYASYTFGWVEDEEEALSREGRAEQAETTHARAIALYARAAELGRTAVALRAGGFEEARRGELDDFRTWLRVSFQGTENAELLFWAGYSWGRHINARYPRESRRDRAFAIALVARSVELDPSYYGASGLALLAYVATQRPGADLDEAERAWERALEVSQRENLLVQVTMARTYALRRRDRDLYIRLLSEVVDADDPSAEMRLSNRIARRRALRSLSDVDRIFRNANPE